MHTLRTLGIALLLICPAALHAQERGLSAVAVQTDTPPVLDGRLDDDSWRQAAPITDFVQIDPVEGATPSQRTEVYLLYDAENLYIGAALHDDRPQDIVRNVMVRQARMYGDDRLHVVLDTFRDGRNGYYFEVNPNGLRADALIENNITVLENWDGVWFAEAVVHENGWSVEIRIPFRTLSFDPDGTVWGINLYRSLASRNEFVSWNTARRVDQPLAPVYAGELSGLSGLQQGLGLDVVPSFSLRQREDHASGDTESRFEPSLDLFYKLSNATTAAITVNTDFSATEVDNQEINLSQYSLFFPEKRVFFLQDAGIFEFGGIERNGRPFFSRTIGLAADGTPLDLNGGVKITGREGRTSFGVLAVQQETASRDDTTDLFVGRVQVGVLDESYVGGIVTSGDPDGDPGNRLGGIDFNFRNTTLLGGEIAEVSGWYQRTRTPGLDDNDAAWRGQFRLPNDQLFLMLTRTVIEENFRPALGFVNRGDIRADEMFARYRARPQDSYWLAHNFSVYANRVTDTDGRFRSSLLEFEPWGPFSSDFDYYGLLWQRHHEILDAPFLLFDRIPVAPGDYVYDFGNLIIDTSQARDLRARVTFGRGGFFDGTRNLVSVDATWRAHPRLSLDFFWSWNDVSLPSGKFIAQVQRVKSNVALSSRLAWITLAQYDSVSRNLGVDTRLQWLPQAGREWFLVLQHGAQRDPENDFITTSNEVVVKIVHTFRF